MAKKKATRKKRSANKKTITLPRKAARRKQVRRVKRPSRVKQIVRIQRGSPLGPSLDVAAPLGGRGLGAHAAGQSGDTQGLSNTEEADSESVEELVEEGQDFEAGVVSGVEHADAGQAEVRTKKPRRG